VDVALSIGRGNADGGILEHSAEAAHSVTLEVGKVDHEVVVGKVVAYDVIFQVLLILDRYAHLAIFVHDVNSKEAVETMLVDGLPVLLLIHTGARISRATLYYGAVDLINKVADEGRLEVVVVATLASRYLHCHMSLSLNAESLVNLNQSLRGDVLGEIDGALR